MEEEDGWGQTEKEEEKKQLTTGWKAWRLPRPIPVMIVRSPTAVPSLCENRHTSTNAHLQPTKTHDLANEKGIENDYRLTPRKHRNILKRKLKIPQGL